MRWRLSNALRWVLTGPVASSALLIFCTGCGGSTQIIFNDTFEADTILARPLADPPGPPAGDRVVATGRRDHVQVLAPPELSGKSVGFYQAFYRHVLELESRPLGGETVAQFNVSWDGLCASRQEHGGVLLRVYGFDGPVQWPAVELLFRQGKVYERTFVGDAEDPVELEIATFEPEARHSVVIKLYRRRNTYDLMIHGGVEPSGQGAGGAGGAVRRDQRPILDPAVWSGDPVGLLLLYPDPLRDTSAVEVYVIDNVQISTGRP